jgi:RNA polymerase sigma-32 factor
MSSSALSTYISGIRARPTQLSRAEEKRLARRVRLTGDRGAARTLVTAHLPLVVKLARDFRRLHPNLLELIQEGNLALIRAVHRYDPQRPVTLAAYVSSWVRTYIARFILANLTASRGFVLETDRADDSGSDPSHDVQRLLRSSLRDWEADLGDDDGPDGGDAALGDPALVMMALMTEDDGAHAPDALMEARQDHDRLTAALPEFERRLTPRERDIFRSRLFSERPSTLMQKGSDLGLSAERVRQIERDLTDRLRAQLADGATARGHRRAGPAIAVDADIGL